MKQFCESGRNRYVDMGFRVMAPETSGTCGWELRMRINASIAAAALLLAACGGSEDGEGELKKGQTVATVNGKDITVHELNAELMGVALPSGDQRKQVEQAALQSLVGRTILADIARERGIDKSPTYLMQRRRANEALLVQMLRSDIASRVTPPTREDALAFMRENPDLFEQRKIYTLDQIQFSAPDDMTKLRRLEPLQTMEQVERQLIEDRVEYRRAPGKLDTVGTNPDLIRQIARLPPGEIFIVPNQGTVVASRITGTEVVPFTGEPALAYAMNLIQGRRVREATERELKAKIEEAQTKIKYQPGFGPPAASGAAGANQKAPARTG
jgi:peptidyl-prolyl cis-trans isomerase C